MFVRQECGKRTTEPVFTQPKSVNFYRQLVSNRLTMCS